MHRRGHALISSWYTVNDKRNEHYALCSCVTLEVFFPLSLLYQESSQHLQSLSG